MQNHIQYVFKVIYMPSEAHANSVKDNLLRFNCIKCSQLYTYFEASIVNKKNARKTEQTQAHTNSIAGSDL